MVHRIFHLITSLEGGGSENYLFQLISESPSDFEHRVYYLKKDGVMGARLRTLGIPVQKIWTPWGLLQELKQQRPDVLHTLLFRAHQCGRLFGHWAGVPLIVSSQQAIDAWHGQWHQALEKLTLPWGHLVLVNSRAAQTLVESRRGNRKWPEVQRIANGVDLSKFMRQSTEVARAALGISKEAILGGTLTRLHREKGADLIPVFAKGLLAKFPKLQLLVAGVGPLESELTRSLEGTPFQNRLHWVGWQEDTRRFLSALDFFFLLSREESFPQALLEASILGLPWVGAEVGGVPELWEAGARGHLFKAEDAPAAADLAGELIRNLSSEKSEALAAVPRLQSRYALGRMVSETYAIFRSKIASNPHP